jgi:hypothetical protein
LAFGTWNFYQLAVRSAGSKACSSSGGTTPPLPGR